NLWLQIKSISSTAERECTAPPYSISSQFPTSAFANARPLILRHGCDSPQRRARIKVRKPKRICRQQFRAGKANLVTIRCQLSWIILLADRQSAPCARRTQPHRLTLNPESLPMARVLPLQRKWRGPRFPYQSQTRVAV